MSPSLCALSRKVFPRLQKRGPIEALRAEVGGQRERQFPRLQKRGPIEAKSADMPALRLSRFHAYKSVAPLKRQKPSQSR